MTTHRDTLIRFDFEHAGICGGIVQLRSVWGAVRRTEDYPDPVRDLLGQALAAVALLGNAIRFQGSVTLQAQGEGAVHLLLAQCYEQTNLRGLARWSAPLPDAGGLALLAGGRLVITLDPGRGRPRFQSTVTLAGVRLADALEEYFLRSEQVPTRLWLAADSERASGLLLQRMPERGEGSEETDEAWSRLQRLTETLTAKELLELPKPEVLKRLYHQERLRLGEQRELEFRCHCSRERIVEVIRSLGRAEVGALSLPDGGVGVDCQFCGRRYTFDIVDVEQIFAQAPSAPGSRQRH